MQSLSTRLISYRAKNADKNGKPMTQVEMCKRIPCSLPSYRNYEHGITTPSYLMQLKIEEIISKE